MNDTKGGGILKNCRYVISNRVKYTGIDQIWCLHFDMEVPVPGAQAT